MNIIIMIYEYLIRYEYMCENYIFYEYMIDNNYLSEHHNVSVLSEVSNEIN